MKTQKRKAAGGYHTTTTAITKTYPNVAPGCKKRYTVCKCCATFCSTPELLGPVHKNTIKLAGNLPDSEVFSRPKFIGFGRDGLARKVGRTTNFVFLTSRPSFARKNAKDGFQSQLGARTMTNVISMASVRAAHSVQTHAQIPAFKPAPVSPERVFKTHAVERQQAIENALSMALHYVRCSETPSNIHAATVKALRAVSMLKQACAESNTSGRA